MQLKNFRIFLKDIISEADRLQRFNIAGQKLTDNKFTDSQKISFIIAVIGVLIFKYGFSNEFAGYVISFLGIFIGLFASVMLSLYDKKDKLIENYIDKDKQDKARIKKIKNLFLQFTALVSFSVIQGLFLIILLFVVLLSKRTQLSIYNYQLVTELKAIHWREVLLFFQQSFNFIHRLFVFYLLSRFFFITTFTVSSFFAFLINEYKRIKLSDYISTSNTNPKEYADDNGEDEGDGDKDWF